MLLLLYVTSLLRMLPSNFYKCFTCLTGRLEDKAAIVRKCALQLLSKLLCFNPFGRFLPLDQMTASLDQYKAKLQARHCPHCEHFCTEVTAFATACIEPPCSDSHDSVVI